MTKVDFFSVQVKYSGSFEAHTKAYFWVLAKAKAERVDPFDRQEEFDDDAALKLDGEVWVEDTYPCNHIATVKWAYINEDEEDEEDGYCDTDDYEPYDPISDEGWRQQDIIDTYRRER